MKNIKVYLKYPWKFPDSPYYKNLIDNPPEGIEFLNTSREKGVITNATKFKISQKIKNFIRNTPQKFGITIANVHKVKTNEKYDLVHGAHCLIKSRDKPWVADLEMKGSLLISGFDSKNWKKKVVKYLEDKNCKKILPWSEPIKKTLVEIFPHLEKKIEVVYPAVPEKKINKKSSDKIRIIYVARAFHLKGGLLALEVMKRLQQKYNIECVVVSDIPEKVKTRYKEIEIHNLMPQKKLFQLMENSDIFLYPTQVDTFGFAILEAMSFGLPSISLNTPATYSMKDIIKDGETGFLINYSNPKDLITKLTFEEEELIMKIFSKCELLIKNPRLRSKISRACLKEIENGKFSIKKRNKQLKKIYEEALK